MSLSTGVTSVGRLARSTKRAVRALPIMPSVRGPILGSRPRNTMRQSRGLPSVDRIHTNPAAARGFDEPIVGPMV